MSPERRHDFARPLRPLGAVSWVFAFIVAFVSGCALVASARSGHVDDLTVVLLEGASVLLVLFAMARVHTPEAPLRALVGARPLGFLPIVTAALMGGFATVPLNELHARVMLRFPIPAQRAAEIASNLGAFSPRQRIAGVIAMSLLSPIFEELLFRGAIATAVTKSSGRWAGAVSATATFALFYGVFDERQIVIGGGLAILLAHARFATGSVLASIAAHLAFACADMVRNARVFGTLDPLAVELRRWPPTLLIAGTALTLVLAALLPKLGRAEGDEPDERGPSEPPRPSRRPPAPPSVDLDDPRDERPRKAEPGEGEGSTPPEAGPSDAPKSDDEDRDEDSK